MPNGYIQRMRQKSALLMIAVRRTYDNCHQQFCPAIKIADINFSNCVCNLQFDFIN